jgi:hypothetical protein
MISIKMTKDGLIKGLSMDIAYAKLKTIPKL